MQLMRRPRRISLWYNKKVRRQQEANACAFGFLAACNLRCGSSAVLKCLFDSFVAPSFIFICKAEALAHVGRNMVFLAKVWKERGSSSTEACRTIRNNRAPRQLCCAEASAGRI